MRHSIMILLGMIFLHIINDFNMQGWLATAKCKSYWKDSLKTTQLYKNDYIMALLAHSFSWSFTMMLPLFLFHLDAIIFCELLVFNTAIHFVIDHLKANVQVINLIEDQCAHIIQIILTWVLFMQVQDYWNILEAIK